MSTDKSKLQKTIELVDQANSQDPNLESYNGKEYPKEFLYSLRMTEWLDKLDPDTSEELKVSARAQHIQRWLIPRNKYPINREGYRKWRKELMDLHADKTADIMKKTGYSDESISRVKSLIRKEKFKTDPESQMLEDVVCLVFLENYFTDFSKEHKDDEKKMNRIISKTWNKMSEKGRGLALDLEIPAEARELIEKALK